MTTAPSSDLKKYVDELIKCPICLEDINKPRILPCFHTYCLDCIKTLTKDRLPGDCVECPSCREKFVIPVDGVDHLPHNFFINGLIDAKKLSDGESNLADPCDGCSDDVSSTGATTVATMFCTFCLQKLCERCSKPHSRFRGGLHKVVPYKSEEKVIAIKLQSCYCDKHDGNKLELHCMDCNENLCVICQISKHRSHDCQAVVDVYGEFVDILQKDSDNVKQQEHQLLQQLELLERKRTELKTEVRDIEQETLKTATNIQRVIDETVEQLTTELNKHASEANKACEELKSQIDFSLAARSSLLRYSKELLYSGNPCDIADAYKGLHTRAEELLADDKQTTVVADYKMPTIAATSDAVYKKVYEYLRDHLSDHVRVTDDQKQADTSGFVSSCSSLERKLRLALYENEELKRKLTKSEQENKQVANLILNEKSMLTSEIKQLKLTAHEKQMDIDKLRDELSSTRRRSEAAQVAQQTELCDRLKEIAAMKRENAHQLNDIDKLKKGAADNETMVSKLKQQITAQQSEIDELKKALVGRRREDSASSRTRLNESLSQDVDLVHSLRPDKPVGGVTTLDKELYVLYEDHKADIDVYDKATCKLMRSLRAKGRGICNDIASCQRYQCIYLADMWNKVIHRVEKANNRHTKWDLGEDKPSGLSVNQLSDVVVTFCEVHKVKVFTTNGDLMKEIDLQPSGIEHPWHTIKISPEKYVVCHGRYNNSPLHRVVIIDGRGRVQQTFGSDKGFNDEQLNVPSKLALLKNGFILVADRYNNRLVMLNRTLRNVKSWNFSGDPLKIWYDEETSGLYVGVNKWNAESETYTSGQVLVYRTE